jgi:uncharacterized metal-binding protein
MQFGIPLFGKRVAPRCSIADSILIMKVNHSRIISKNYIQLEDFNWIEFIKTLIERRIDILVCGGINKEDKEQALLKGISVIDNVACSEEEIYYAIEKEQLRPGYGFTSASDIPIQKYDDSDLNDIPDSFNCINCTGKECESGKRCPYLKNLDIPAENEINSKMLDSVLDISLEEERILCRLSELIYYALEMNYKKIGIAYCTDLNEATEILTSVLKRFFDVKPVCCKVFGKVLSEKTEAGNAKIACNPLAQADILNRLETDLNIIVGLCIGADCIFSQASKAPVTTLFVKDKSLANNPIGAIYSEYYLKEVENSILK